MNRRTCRAWLLAGWLAGCDASSASDAPVVAARASASLSASARASAGASASASASAPASASASADPLAEPVLFDEAGRALGQTDERPSLASAAFKKRIELLWQAIVADDPSVAMPAFFPLVAYEQVKDIDKPGADWKHRLVRAFERNVHEYHRELGSDAGGATLLGVDVNDAKVKWMKRGAEGNKLGYYRVTRNKLRYRDAAGADKTLELTSLISWRGEWFIVHLHGFK